MMNQDKQPNSTMHSPLNDAEVTKLAKDALDQSIDDLSPSISTRLAEARYQALEQNRRKGDWKFNSQQMFKFAAPAFASIVAIAIFLNLTSETGPDDQLFADIQSIEHMENFLIYSNTEDTELAIIEDMEFAYWLSEELANEKNIPIKKELGV